VFQFSAKTIKGDTGDRTIYRHWTDIFLLSAEATTILFLASLLSSLGRPERWFPAGLCFAADVLINVRSLPSLGRSSWDFTTWLEIKWAL